MTVSHVEVLVEEPSMEAALCELLPHLLGAMSFKVYPFQCKSDLLMKLPVRLRGYGSWLPGDWRIMVVVDRDNEDCHNLKQRLDLMASNAGLATRSSATGNRYRVINRIAIEELEAWYFGDWDAVRAAYPRVPASIPGRANYRSPDAIRGGTWEAFERILKRAGYFRNGLRKIEAARAVTPHWDADRNTSPSFRALRDALRDLARP